MSRNEITSKNIYIPSIFLRAVLNSNVSQKKTDVESIFQDTWLNKHCFLFTVYNTTYNFIEWLRRKISKLNSTVYQIILIREFFSIKQVGKTLFWHQFQRLNEQHGNQGHPLLCMKEIDCYSTVAISRTATI